MVHFLKRYGLAVCVGAYTGGLILLHLLGRFPAPGGNDISRLAGSPLVAFQGRVVNFPMTRWGQTRFLMEGHDVPQGTYHGRVVVDLKFPLEDLAPGDGLRIRGWLGRPRRPSWRRTFDERAYWAGFRAYAVLHVWSAQGLQRLSTSRHLAWSFHQRVKRFWFEHLPADEAALLSCICLGTRGVLPADIKNQCIRAGVYHILVVSGQKMAWVIALVVGLLRIFRVPRRWTFWLCCPLILFYAQAVGADPPVLRAATMAVAALGALSLGRDVPRYQPFLLAWFWILLREPEALFGASFQLSFGATASLLAVLPLINPAPHPHRLARWFVEAGLVSLAVHLGVWPLLVHYFHQLSLVGILANWTIFPLSGVLMVLGLLVGAWGAWAPQAVPGFMIHWMHGLMRVTLRSIQSMSGWSWSAIHVPALGWELWWVYYTLFICILFKVYGAQKFNGS